MDFEKFDSKRYRSLDIDELEERKAQLIELAENPDTPDDVISELDGETERCAAEFKRREKVKNLRDAGAAAVLGGQGKVIASTKRGLEVKDEGSVSLRDNTDPNDTPEYRDAFMNLVTRGIETRADAFTMTTDAPVAIPTTLSNEIIEKLDTYGEIYPLVSKSNFPGAVDIAIDDFDFTAKWVGEDEVTDTQKAERKQKITFKYNEFEARVAWTWLAGITTFDNFTSKFAPKMSKAIVKLLEESIVNGTGEGQMLGITKDPRITNVVEMTAAQFDDWQMWHSMVDASIDPAYDDGNFLMPKTTWNKHIDTMADSAKAPIAQFHYDPVSGKRINTIIGKNCTLLGGNYFPDFDKAAVGDVVAVYGDLSKYDVNWQPGGQINVIRYADNDKRKNKLLGYGVCDGRVTDPYGFMLIKKANPSA